MADSSTFHNVVTRTTAEAALKRGLRRERSPARKAGRFVLWLMVIAMAIAALTPLTRFARQEIQTWLLVQSIDLQLADSDAIVPSPEYYEALSELAKDDTIALAAARRAVAADPSRAFAWARIAWIETVNAGRIAAPALEALTKSMDACPLCSEDLVRWRFNFVLANWNEMPEALRARAFEHAEFLSWSGDNAEFLAEMRIKSELAGLPFSAYRAAVKTPANGWVAIPPPDAVATADPAAPGG
jgi:hypothetical protein